jgi:hypothetical protein
MRRSSLLTILVLLAATAVSSWASEPSPAAAGCPAAPANALDQVLSQGQPAPLFATGYLCGTCSGTCSGLTTGSPCTEGGQTGICIGILSPNGTPARCLATQGTGNACFCGATDPPEG